jgi:hypothetical protein
MNYLNRICLSIVQDCFAFMSVDRHHAQLHSPCVQLSIIGMSNENRSRSYSVALSSRLLNDIDSTQNMLTFMIEKMSCSRTCTSTTSYDK